MKVKTTNRLPARVWRFGIGGMLLAAGTMIDHRMGAAQTDALGPVFGQTVIGNPVPEQPLQTEDQANQPNEMNVFQPAGAGAETPLPALFQYGPLRLHPRLDYRVIYGNGVQYAPGNSSDVVIQEISPGIGIDLGPHWAVNYTPTIRFYSSKQFQDGVDHTVDLTGSVDYEAWKFGLNHDTAITSAPMIQTGSQTDQSIHDTTFSASRPLNSNFTVDLAVNQTITLVSGFDNSYDWNTLDWLNYQFGPRLNVGLGAGAGYVLVEANGTGTGNGISPVIFGSGPGNQTYEDLEGRVNWRATEKLSFAINGGLEDRQFESGGAGDSLNPIFGAAIQYQPFKDTKISLNASRTVSSSDYYLAAQEVDTTEVGVDVSQELFRHFNLGVGATYTRMSYGTGAGAGAAGTDRSDDVISFNARLSHPFYKRGTWSIFYQYSKDNSSQQGFGYDSNQVGFEVSYGF